MSLNHLAFATTLHDTDGILQRLRHFPSCTPVTNSSRIPRCLSRSRHYIKSLREIHKTVFFFNSIAVSGRKLHVQWKSKAATS